MDAGATQETGGSSGDSVHRTRGGSASVFHGIGTGVKVGLKGMVRSSMVRTDL